MQKIKELFRAFNYRNYRLFFFGQGISFIGTMMQNTAQAWLVYRLTKSAAMLGLVAFCSQFPAFFMAPLSGLLSDRFEKRKIILFADIFKILQAVALTTLVITGVIKPWHIAALAVLLGLANGLETTARHAMVPEIVDDKKDMGNAIAVNSILFNTGRVAGPALAGFVVAWLGEGFCFGANALSYIALIYSLLAMKLHQPTPDHAAHPVEELKEGYKYAFSSKTIRPVIFLTAFVSLTGASAVVLIPVFAGEILNGGPQALGLLMGSLGFGAVIGGLFLASRRDGKKLGNVIAAATFIFGFWLCLLPLAKNIIPAMIILAAAGSGMMLMSSASNTFVQSMARDRLRGRVMGFYLMAVTGFGPLGNLLTGYMAKQWGAKPVICALGALTFAAAALFGLRQEHTESRREKIEE
ncbi:MAG: MFS transporter [Candidatus Goldiibacteriota bacterium]|jgi:MFS family permease